MKCSATQLLTRSVGPSNVSAICLIRREEVRDAARSVAPLKNTNMLKLVFRFGGSQTFNQTNSRRKALYSSRQQNLTNWALTRLKQVTCYSPEQEPSVEFVSR